MKLTEIRIDRTKNLGDFNNIKLGFTAVIAEDENEPDAIDRLKKLLDWEINREDYERMYGQKKARLAELVDLEDASETGLTDDQLKERARLTGWTVWYEERKTEIAAFSKSL